MKRRDLISQGHWAALQLPPGLAQLCRTGTMTEPRDEPVLCVPEPLPRASGAPQLCWVPTLLCSPSTSEQLHQPLLFSLSHKGLLLFLNHLNKPNFSLLTHSFVIVSTLITLHQKHHLKCCHEFLHCFLLNLLQPNPSCLPKESRSWALQGLCKKLLQPLPCISEGQHQNQELSVCTRNSLATCRVRCLPASLVTPAAWVVQMSYSLYPAASCLALSHIPNPFCTPAQAHSAAQLPAWVWSYGRCHTQGTRDHFVPLKRRDSSCWHFPADGQRIHHIWP